MSSERQITHWARCWQEHEDCARALFDEIASIVDNCNTGDEVGAVHEIDDLLQEGQSSREKEDDNDDDA